MLTFSWLLAAGGVGALVGYATVETVGMRLRKPLLIGLACVIAGLGVVPALIALSAATLCLGGVLMGFAYAWARVPADTLAQKAVPDRYRGRVFTVMDLGFNSCRVLGALSALVVVPLVGAQGGLLVAGLLFLAWAPVAPVWLRRREPG
jgi:MFS family permease